MKSADIIVVGGSDYDEWYLQQSLIENPNIWYLSQEDFINWTRSDAFRKAHEGVGEQRDVYLGHPIFEGFEVII